jgi:hypothetical protein
MKLVSTLLGVLTALHSGPAEAGWKGFVNWCESAASRRPGEIAALQEALAHSPYVIEPHRQEADVFTMSVTGALNDVFSRPPFSEAFPESRARLISWVLGEWLEATSLPDLHIQKVSTWLGAELDKPVAYSRADLMRIRDAYRAFTGKEKWGAGALERIFPATRDLIEAVEGQLLDLQIQNTSVAELENNWAADLASTLRRRTRVPLQNGRVERLVTEYCQAILHKKNLEKSTTAKFLAQWAHDLRGVNAAYHAEVIRAFQVIRVTAMELQLESKDFAPVAQAMQETAATWGQSDSAQEAVRNLIAQGSEKKELNL